MQFLEKLSDKLSERLVGILFTILVVQSACECDVSTCMFVCVHVQVCMQAHMHTCMWRLEVDGRCPPLSLSTLSIETGSLT